MSSATATPIFVFHSLNVGRGGLTTAVIEKANMLAKHFDDVQFFTFFYQQKHKEVIQKVYDAGMLDPRIKVCNVFVDLDPLKQEKERDKKQGGPQIREGKLEEVQDPDAPAPSYWCYKNGQCVIYKRMNRNGKPVFVDYLDDDGQPAKREEFDEDGYVVKITEKDTATNKPVADHYVSYNGEKYLTVWRNLETGKEEHCHLFYPEPKEFDHLQQLIAYWIDQKLIHIKGPVLIGDSHHSGKVFLNVRSKRARRVIAFHGNHLQQPDQADSGVRSFLKPIFERLNRFDRVVFLTNRQKEDVAEQFGKYKGYRVIPHAAKSGELNTDTSVHTDPYLAISMARLKPVKRLDEAIRAFRYVVAEIPEARYEIYGLGPEKEKLQRLIEQLDLTNHVQLKGYTNEPMAKYKRAACSLLTSAYEGSPLVVFESLTVGTPVVSYDIKYGPDDVIRDGVDGFIVPRRDPQQLSKQIVRIMKSPRLTKQMSKNAVKVTKRFSINRYRRNWVNLVEELAVIEQARERKRSIFAGIKSFF